VRNTAGTSKAGITGGGTGWLLYHGGDIANRVPYKQHGSGINVTILQGNTSQGGTIDLTPYGFSVSPIISLTIRQFNISTIRRRVAVNIEDVSATSLSFRAIQTSNEVMDFDSVYTVHWMATQFTPTTAAG
jgi:hypothetical protein